jgi:hypothetical protein
LNNKTHLGWLQERKKLVFPDVASSAKMQFAANCLFGSFPLVPFNNGKAAIGLFDISAEIDFF